MVDAPVPPIAAPEPVLRVAGRDADSIRRAAEEFEAVVIAELIGPIFEPLDTDSFGGGGAGERMFRPMLVQEYAKLIAAAGGVGFADAVARELIALQGAPPAPPEPR